MQTRKREWTLSILGLSLPLSLSLFPSLKQQRKWRRREAGPRRLFWEAFPSPSHLRCCFLWGRSESLPVDTWQTRGEVKRGASYSYSPSPVKAPTTVSRKKAVSAPRTGEDRAASLSPRERPAPPPHPDTQCHKDPLLVAFPPFPPHACLGREEGGGRKRGEAVHGKWEERPSFSSSSSFRVSLFPRQFSQQGWPGIGPPSFFLPSPFVFGFPSSSRSFCLLRRTKNNIAFQYRF